MANSLYPGFVKIFYTGNAHTHQQLLPCKPFVGVGGDWYVEHNGDILGQVWTAAVDALIAKEVGFLKTTDGFNRAELWTLASPTSDPLFREAYDIAVAGAATAPVVPFSQYVLTHRTSLGGVGRLYIMEGPISTDTFDRAPLAAGGGKTLSDYMIGTTGWVRGRDGGKLVTPISAIGKVNDKLRKKYRLDT